MIIQSARFLTSSVQVAACPPPSLPEYAFIGRSNVGKSSLINNLTGFGKLAKISSTPGKTQLINHFIINERWYLVDLPGYGFAKVSQRDRAKWQLMVRAYLRRRENLQCVCALIDARLPPQRVDLEFVQWLGENEVPLVLVFTKADKQSARQTELNVAAFHGALQETWAELPRTFITSANTGTGRDELLAFISEVNQAWVPPITGA